MAPADSTSNSADNAPNTSSAPTPAPATARLLMRYDIEGLRGVAIALVVVFHVFIGRVSAGVDVFLFLGGIFFFSSQLANARNPRGLTLIQSVIRILRRLFPLLAVVVGATLAGSLAVMNRLVHLTMAEDALTALGYYINWQLAFSGREYAAVRTTVSPFQHLWSMSAQLQIYLGSLVIITIIALVFRRFSRGALVVFLGITTAASFAYAVHLHGVDQELNYYSTFSRFWEIGFGGLIGLWLRRNRGDKPTRHIPPGIRWVLGFAGLGMIVITGWVVDGAANFPGPWTLLPLTGAFLIVLAGSTGRPVGLTRLLETAPFQFLGRSSYALYLWHWPLLVITLNYFDATRVTLGIGIGVIAASIGLAWASNKLIEKPLRQQEKPARSWVLFSPSYWKNSFAAWPKALYGALIVVLAGAVAASPNYLQRQSHINNEELWALANERGLYPGAESFLHNAFTPESMPLIPPLDNFQDLEPQTQRDQCVTGFEGTQLAYVNEYGYGDEPCWYGDEHGKTLYVIGGSHSEHYIPALDIIGARQGVRFVPIVKAGCPVNADIPLWDGSDFPDCREWSKNVMDYIEENPPELGIFMTGTRPKEHGGFGLEIVPEEYVETVQQFTDWGIHSYLMRDNPWHVAPGDPNQPLNIRTCVAEMMEGHFNGAGPDQVGRDFPGLAEQGTPNFEEVLEINSVCGSSVADYYQEVDPSIEAYDGLDVTLLDVSAGLCREGWCPAIIGNMVAYRDVHHYTNVFAATLAPEIEAQMFDPNHQIPPMDVGLAGAVGGDFDDDGDGTTSSPTDDSDMGSQAQYYERSEGGSAGSGSAGSTSEGGSIFRTPEGRVVKQLPGVDMDAAFSGEANSTQDSSSTAVQSPTQGGQTGQGGGGGATNPGAGNGFGGGAAGTAGAGNTPWYPPNSGYGNNAGGYYDRYGNFIPYY